MEEAVKYATEEQRTDRTFEMYRHAQVEEPMEVDIVQEGKEAEKLAQIQETVQKLTKQLDRVSRQMRSPVWYTTAAPLTDGTPGKQVQYLTKSALCRIETAGVQKVRCTADRRQSAR